MGKFFLEIFSTPPQKKKIFSHGHIGEQPEGFRTRRVRIRKPFLSADTAYAVYKQKNIPGLKSSTPPKINFFGEQ